MIGKKLSDRYEILSELGRGGMGVVYRAKDPVLDRDVAIKLISAETLTPEAEKRFQSEAQVIAKMDHPAIVSIHDFGRHEGSLFFVMPVLEGKNLRHCLRDKTLTQGQVLDVATQVGEALAYSHERGVVHRDIKPENIMVREESGSLRVRVMDFGLARSHNVTNITKTGMLVGTMSYISPEQILGRTVDERADIYALGTVIYEMVTGSVPFTGELQSVLYRTVHEVPQSPRKLGAEIGDELDACILEALAKDPAKRTHHASDMVKLLRRYQSGLRDSDVNRSVIVTRTLMVPRPALSPFVGRTEELSKLQQCLNDAVAGKCHFVTVAGEAGIGKTRMLDELENLAVARDIRVLHGRCLERDGSFPYLGFCQAIQEYFEQLDAGSNPTAVPDLSDVAADLIALFPMLSEIEPIRSAASGASQLAAAGATRSAENRMQIFELLARTLTRLAGGQPLVLLLEELHGAEVSIEALQYIVRRLGPTPTLVVATYRSTDVDRRHPLAKMLAGFRGDRQFAPIAIGPLSSEEHHEFVATIVGGGSEVSDKLAQNLFEASEGNPFFTKELVRSMLDSGNIVQDDTGSWSLSGAAISSDALPATIQQAVEERMGRLPDDLREILSITAVMGRTFEFDDLERLAEDADDLERAVDRLVQEGLIEEDRQSRGDRLTFSSNVVREVLYSELSRRRRRSLHRRYAKLLEKRHSGRPEGVYPQLLYHFYEADEPQKSVEYGLLQAKKSLKAFSPDEAIRSSRMALEFLDSEWEGERAIEGEARMLLAAAHRMAGDVPAALKEYGQAVDVFERENRARDAIEALLAAGKAAWQVRQADEARRWVERGMTAAREAGDNESLAQLLALAATLASLRGEYGPVQEYLEESEKLGAGAQAITEEIPEGGRLAVALANSIAATIPVTMQLDEEFEVLSNVFETLLTIDEDGNLHPLLCASWEALEDGKAFRFVLRDDVRFQDGHRLTARDVKRSFEEAVRSASADLPGGLSAIRGVKTFASAEVDQLTGALVHADDTLEVQLEEALPIYPALLTDSRTAIIRSTPGGERPLGTGPFRIAEMSEERVVLDRNADYWRFAPPRIEAIEFLTGLSAAAIAERFRAGELDLARDLLPEDLDAILRERRFQGRLVEAPQKFTYFILFNVLGSGVTRDPRVREALSGVIRVRDLVWRSLGRFAVPGVGTIPPGILGHDAGRRPQTLTEEDARGLLAAAGHADGLALHAAVHPLIQDRYGTLLEAIFESWLALGINVEVTTPDTDSYLRAWHTNDGLDLLIMRWQPDFDDPDSCTHTLYHSAAGQLGTWFASARADEILNEARRAVRPDVREALYQKFENLLLEAHAVLPLFHDVGYRIAGPKVKGVTLGSIHPNVNYAELGKAASVSTPADVGVDMGGVVNVPMTGKVLSLDPMMMTFAEEAEVLSNVYENLLRDVGDARIEPWLAEGFRVENSGRCYRFRLRNDVLFHDGRRLSVRDVRSSLERLLQRSGSEGRQLYAPIKGAQALLDGKATVLEGFRIHSANEFSIELDKAVSFFPVLLASPHSYILPEGEVGHGVDEAVVGTGPFRVVRHVPGNRIELERHGDYWRQGYPKCERLVFSFEVSPDKILSEFRAGRFSMAADLYPADVESLRRDARYGASYREMPGLSTYFVVPNTRRGPLVDRGMREYLAGAADVERIVKQTLGRLALPAAGLIPPGLLGHDPRRGSMQVVDKDATQAAPAESVELTAAVHPIFRAEYSSFYQEWTAALERAGIRLRVVAEQMADYLEAQNATKVDLVIGRWVADYPDAHTFAHLFDTSDGFVGHFAGTPETDELIARGRTESDPGVRHEIYRELEERVARDLRIIPLFHEQVYRFVRPEIEGVSLSYWAPTVSYANLRVRRHE